MIQFHIIIFDGVHDRLVLEKSLIHFFLFPHFFLYFFLFFYINSFFSHTFWNSSFSHFCVNLFGETNHFASIFWAKRIFILLSRFSKSLLDQWSNKQYSLQTLSIHFLLQLLPGFVWTMHHCCCWVHWWFPQPLSWSFIHVLWQSLHKQGHCLCGAIFHAL